MLRGFVIAILAIGAGCAEVPESTSTIYLNRDGASLTGGSDDAARGVSSIVDKSTVLPGTTMSPAAWTEVVSCVRAAYAQFDVSIVDTRPAHDDFMMAVFGGNGAELGLGVDQHGKAPIDSDGCDTINNGVAFVFTANVNEDAAAACETAVHEIAHLYSIDHQLLASEPTSYLPFDGRRGFRDVEAKCGENTERPCICGRDTQSSQKILLERLGAAANVDDEAPSVELSSTTTRGGLQIHVAANDASGVGMVTLRYSDDARTITSTCGDGVLQCTKWNGDWSFSIPSVAGRAMVRAEAVDMVGNRAMVEQAAN